MKKVIKKILGVNANEDSRNAWLKNILTPLPPGQTLLDTGAGELRNKPFCDHLDYVSQDLSQYEGDGNAQGLQTGKWDTRKLDLVCDIVNIPKPDASFDVVLCIEVFEYLPDVQKELDEFSRRLNAAVSN